MSEPITLASWNVNSLNVRKDQVLDLLRETGWDVLALQETKMTDAVFPASDFERLGYGVRFTGERAYNGVAVLFRKDRFEEVRPEDVLLEMPGRTDPQRRFLALTLRPKGGEAFRVVDVYVPNGSRSPSQRCSKPPRGSSSRATSTSRPKTRTFGIRPCGAATSSSRRRSAVRSGA